MGILLSQCNTDLIQLQVYGQNQDHMCYNLKRKYVVRKT